MKMKNGKRIVFRFPFSYGNENQMKTLNIQSKNLFSMKIIRILFFNLAKTQNGTLGTHSISNMGQHHTFVTYLLTSKSIEINIEKI